MKFVRPNAFVILLLGLVTWGPPRLRLEDRDASVALDTPFALDAAAIFQVVVVILAGVVAAIMILHLRKSSVRGMVKGPVMSYALLGLLAITSTIYSPNPPYTAFFATKFIVAFLLPVALVGRGGVPAASLALRCVRFVAVGQTLVILLLGALAPDLAGSAQNGNGGYRLIGGSLADYGISGAVWLIFLTADFLGTNTLRRRLMIIGAAVFPLTYLFFARTRTTLIGCLVGCLLVIAMRRPGKATVATIVMLAAIAIASGTQTFAPVENYLRRGQSNDDLETLSGRTEVFRFLLDEWRQNPIVGSGYAAGSRVSLIRYMQETNSSLGAAHDVLSRSLSDLGLLGAILVGLTYLLVMRQIGRIISRAMRSGVKTPGDVTLAGGIVALNLILGIGNGGIMEASCSLVIAMIVLGPRGHLGTKARPPFLSMLSKGAPVLSLKPATTRDREIAGGPRLRSR